MATNIETMWVGDSEQLQRTVQNLVARGGVVQGQSDTEVSLYIKKKINIVVLIVGPDPLPRARPRLPDLVPHGRPEPADHGEGRSPDTIKTDHQHWYDEDGAPPRRDRCHPRRAAGGRRTVEPGHGRSPVHPTRAHAAARASAAPGPQRHRSPAAGAARAPGRQLVLIGPVPTLGTPRQPHLAPRRNRMSDVERQLAERLERLEQQVSLISEHLGLAFDDGRGDIPQEVLDLARSAGSSRRSSATAS